MTIDQNSYWWFPMMFSLRKKTLSYHIPLVLLKLGIIYRVTWPSLIQIISNNDTIDTIHIEFIYIYIYSIYIYISLIISHYPSIVYINIYIYSPLLFITSAMKKKTHGVDPGNLQPGPFLRPGTLRHRDTCDRDAWSHPGCAGGLSRATWAIWDLAHGDVGMGSKLIKWP